ncbi:hypothetical protein CLAIMM_01854 [Cladophialophora immunda]|nr:hypothetical protein CLAIMM_01854 [Cladophialophora immunda]
MRPSTLPPPPPTYGGNKFGSLVYRHLITDKTFSSPYLSFTQNPKRAIEAHLAKSSAHLSIAVIDYNVLEEEIKRLYGIGNGPWLVPSIVTDYGFKDLKKIEKDQPVKQGVKGQEGYTGRGEFLIWGSVPCDPVAILCCEEALQVYDVLNSLKDSGSVIDYASGVSIGQCLKSIPSMYKAVVARKLINAFKIPGYEKARDNIYLKKFIQGVEASSPEPSDSDSLPDEVILSRVRNRSRSAETVKYSKSARMTERVHVTVEAREKMLRSANTALPCPEPAEDLQDLLDCQLAEMGSEFGVTTAPFDSPTLSRSNATISGFRRTPDQSPSEGIRLKPTEVQMDTGGDRMEEEDKTADDTVESSRPQEHIKHVDDPEVDIFAWQVRWWATIPTPTPTPPPVYTRELHNLSTSQPNDSTTKSNRTEKRDREPAMTEQVVIPPQCPTACQTEKEALSSNIIDLTTEDTNCHASEKAASLKNTNRLGAKRHQRRHAVTKTRTKITSNSNSTSTFRKVDVRRGNSHRMNCPSKAAHVDTSILSSLTEDEDEIQIIAERRYHNRRRHVRRTKTIITIRSRSLSESIIFNQRG